MKKIPPKIRQELNDDPFMHICARWNFLHDHECQANPMNGQLIEWEHALIFGGNQVQYAWAIVPFCWLVHSGGQLIKEIGIWIALNRAPESELREISKAVDYIAMRERLNEKYGTLDKCVNNGGYNTGNKYCVDVENLMEDIQY